MMRTARVLPMVTGETSVDVERPRTRGDCADGERPCPWAGCRHHLFIDSVTAAGEIRSHFDEVETMAETCSLDLADRGGMTMKQVADIFGVSRQLIEQMEKRAGERMKDRLPPDILEGWTHAVDYSAEVGGDVERDDGFRAQLDEAYKKIVPKTERGTQLLRWKPKTGAGT